MDAPTYSMFRQHAVTIRDLQERLHKLEEIIKSLQSNEAVRDNRGTV